MPVFVKLTFIQLFECLKIVIVHFQVVTIILVKEGTQRGTGRGTGRGTERGTERETGRGTGRGAWEKTRRET